MKPRNKKIAFRFPDHSLTWITLALSLIMLLLLFQTNIQQVLLFMPNTLTINVDEVPLPLQSSHICYSEASADQRKEAIVSDALRSKKMTFKIQDHSLTWSLALSQRIFLLLLQTSNPKPIGTSIYATPRKCGWSSSSIAGITHLLLGGKRWCQEVECFTITSAL